MQNNQPLIMVVDDQVDFVEGVKLILEEEGYNVWTAFNGREALDQLQKNLNSHDVRVSGPLPDLILADIMMPVMDGYTLYENTRANSHLKYIPFVFLTAKTDSTDIERGKTLGVEDYLTKPCLPDILLASVRGQLKHKPSHDDKPFELSTSEPNPVAEEGNVNKIILFIGIGVVVIIFVLLMSLDIPWA